MATIVEEDVPASINDIEIVGDNILFSADDGFLYIANGDETHLIIGSRPQSDSDGGTD